MEDLDLFNYLKNNLRISIKIEDGLNHKNLKVSLLLEDNEIDRDYVTEDEVRELID